MLQIENKNPLSIDFKNMFKLIFKRPLNNNQTIISIRIFFPIFLHLKFIFLIFSNINNKRVKRRRGPFKYFVF